MKRFVILTIILLVIAVPTGIALAAPAFDTVVEAGDVINNDVTLFGEDLEVQEGATINGSVVIFNGDAYVAGQINGDLVLFNGDLEATSTAVINGECVLMNGSLTDETESGISCSSISKLDNLAATVGALSKDNRFTPPTPPEMQRERPSRGGSFVGDVIEAAVNSLVLGALAFLVASLLPNHMRQVQMTVKRKPLASGGVGLLTAVAIPSLIALLSIISAILLIICIGILGFGVVIVLAVGLAAALIFGWVSIGGLVGRRLADPLKLQNRSLPMTAAVGTMVMTLGLGLLNALLPPVGLVNGLIFAVGLGAVALTQFGTRAYPLHPSDDPDIVIYEDPDKISSILETLPLDDPAEFKNN